MKTETKHSALWFGRSWWKQALYAKYSTFQFADSSTNYRLTVADYSGDAGDSFSNDNGMMFTTRDHGGNYCANQYKGVWWYTNCHYSNLNGIYSSTAYAWSRYQLVSLERPWLFPRVYWDEATPGRVTTTTVHETQKTKAAIIVIIIVS